MSTEVEAGLKALVRSAGIDPNEPVVRFGPLPRLVSEPAETFRDVLVRGEPRLDGYAHFDPEAGVFIWCDSRESAVDLVTEDAHPQYVLRVVEIYPAGRQG